MYIWNLTKKTLMIHLNLHNILSNKFMDKF